MLKKEIEKVLNEQLNKEFYSAYLYLDMATWCASEGLPGFANWMKVQAMEERSHAMKIYDYIEERGGKVTLEAIEKPKYSCDNIMKVMEQVLEHERYISNSINKIVEVSYKEKDYATANMLQWFVAEQVEEEASVSEICDQIKLLKGEGNGLFIIDRELKSRVFVDTINN